MGYVILNRITGKRARISKGKVREITPYFGSVDDAWNYIKKNLNNNSDYYWPHNVGR